MKISNLLFLLQQLLTHTSFCPHTDCVQFQDHDLVLGGLADFPAIFLEKFLADKDFVGLSVPSQAQLTELLPMSHEGDRKKNKNIDSIS